MKRRHENLRAYFEASGETQAHFAARVGSTQSVISRIVDGKTLPGFSLALRIAKAAGIPVESLAPERVA